MEKVKSIKKLCKLNSEYESWEKPKYKKKKKNPIYLINTENKRKSKCGKLCGECG